MAETNQFIDDRPLVMIEPDDRLVVLARTIHASGVPADAALKDSAANLASFGKTCLGSALYRHRTVFQNNSEALVWSHFELSYFRDIVPNSVIRKRVFDPQPAGTNLLRAEILLTTPSSFILPRNWQGSSERPNNLVSLEFLQVLPKYLGEYRQAMREYCGPAAKKLVEANRFGTFRAMETAVVLHQAAELNIDWNQIHLCELNPNGFDGFGVEFEAALRKDIPDGTKFSDTFADLGRLRTVPRWTFNDPIVEADTAIALHRTE